MRRLTIALALVTLCLPILAAATAVTWIIPAGGETWTAGTQHTIAWAGGFPTTVLTYHPLPLSMTGYVIGAYFPNTGSYTFNIPANTPPGPYVLQIGFVEGGTPSYSAEFTIGAAPECLNGCSLVSASTAPGAGICGTTAVEAVANAEAWIQAQLESQCFEGYSINPGSVTIDVTFVPVVPCYVGYVGAYVAEASGFGCCCPDAVPTETQSFGDIKARYF